MTRKINRRYISAAAAAALLMGSASAMSAIGEHDERRTDPAQAYEQQEAQRDQEMRRDDDVQRETTAQRDEWQDDQAEVERERQVDQERQVGTGEASQQLDQLAEQHDNLSTFIKAVQEAGMAEALVGTTEYTIFAPTDEAFEQHDRSADELLRPENREELISLLRAHIVADDVDPQMARSIGQARTIDGGTVDLRADEEQEDRFQVGDASVVESDIQQNNLRIYAIDQVLRPSGELAAFEPAATDRDDADTQRDTDVQRDDDLDRDSDWDTQRDPGTSTDTDWDTDTGDDTDW
jgi:uncharacterized surface protein with fasciclin (FAS1) repeats